MSYYNFILNTWVWTSGSEVNALGYIALREQLKKVEQSVLKRYIPFCTWES